VGLAKINMGSIFMGSLFMLISAYLVMAVGSLGGKIFGGGILAILGLLSLAGGLSGIGSIRKKK
jgi:hypothetical protein